MAPSVVVIIGSGGIGMACARRLACGRHLILADFSESLLSNALSTLEDDGHNVEGHIVDISDYDSVKRVAEIAAAAGRVESVVNTAGVTPAYSSSKRIYEINILGTANIVDAFFPVVSDGASVVCIASMAGHFASLSPQLENHLATASLEKLLHHEELNLDSSTAEAYTTSKRGNIIRVQAAAKTWGQKGVRLNTISPGVVSTAVGRKEMESSSGAKALVDFSAVGRAGAPEEIANVVAFLVGSESSFITGADILVDGGAVVSRRWNLAA